MDKDLNLALCIITSREISQIRFLLDSLKCISFKFREVFIVYNSKILDDKDFPSSIKNIKNLKIISYKGLRKQPEMRNLALFQCNSKYIWFVDDDVKIPNYSIERLDKLICMMNFLPEIAFAAGKIIEKRAKNLRKIINKPMLNIVFGLNFPFGVNPEYLVRTGYKYIEFRNKKFPLVSFVQGTSMLYRSSYLKSIGGFNEDLFSGYASFEDSEPALILNKKYFGIFTDYLTVHHLKLKRVKSVSRNSISYSYMKGIIRNYRRTLIWGAIPNKFLSFIYFYIHSTYQVLKIMIIALKSKNMSYFCEYFSIALLMLSEIMIFSLTDLYKDFFRKSYRSLFLKRNTDKVN